MTVCSKREDKGSFWFCWAQLHVWRWENPVREFLFVLTVDFLFIRFLLKFRPETLLLSFQSLKFQVLLSWVLVRMTLASRLSYSFECSLTFCMTAVIFPSHLLKHSLTLGCSPNMQTVSPSAWRLLLPPSVSLLIHPGLFSLYLVLYVGGLSPSLLLSQALFYYTYVNTFIFHSKKASGSGEMVDKAHTRGYKWGILCISSFPLTLYNLIPHNKCLLSTYPGLEMLCPIQRIYYIAE